MSVPTAPYRCPPGPYERACLVANYFKKAKPKSKIILLDGNPDIASKKALFMGAWKELLCRHDRLPAQQRARSPSMATR